MSKSGRVLAAALAGLAVAATAGLLCRSPAQEPSSPRSAGSAPGKAGGVKQQSPLAAAVRQRTAEFAAAFNKGDAKQTAGFWMPDGEFIGPDGNTLRGRKAIEKGYAEFFKKNPKATLELHTQSVRAFGHHAALEAGTLKLRLPGKRQPAESRYSVLHVRDEDGWHMASVHEWTPDPAELVSLRDLEWLVGEWVGKEGGTEVRTRYAWDEDRAFLHCRFTIKKDGKVVASGLQVIGKDPAVGLRSWQFDRSGRFGQSFWSRDGDRWVIEANATLPDGRETHAVSVLIPRGKDAFTWQLGEYTAAGVSLSGTPPLKVTRVKGGQLGKLLPDR
jgi:uncharacterized protein (TIGR02246 family)